MRKTGKQFTFQYLEQHRFQPVERGTHVGRGHRARAGEREGSLPLSRSAQGLPGPRARQAHRRPESGCRGSLGTVRRTRSVSKSRQLLHTHGQLAAATRPHPCAVPLAGPGRATPPSQRHRAWRGHVPTSTETGQSRVLRLRDPRTQNQDLCFSLQFISSSNWVSLDSAVAGWRGGSGR